MQSLFLVIGLLLALSGSALALRALARSLGVRVPTQVLGLGVALVFLLFLPWLSGAQLLAPYDFLTVGQVPGVTPAPDAERYETFNDVIFQFLPWEAELRRLWGRGSSAFWSDALEGGSSLWLNPQASVLSPTAWVARAFRIEDFFLVKAALQLLVCFLGIAVLVRRLGAGWQSAALAGLAAALSGAMMPWTMFTHTAAVAWVPWTTVGLLVVARTPSPHRLIGAAIAVALLLMAGHPEVAFTGGCLGIAVVVWLRSRHRTFRSQCLGVVVAAGLGFLLAAPAVLPFLAAVPGSQRTAELNVLHEVLAEVELSASPKSWFIDDHFRVLSASLHPNAFGRPFVDPYSGPYSWLESASGYSGVWALAGAGLCLGLWLRRSFVLIGFAAVVLLLAADFVPLLWMARALPALDSMAFLRSALVACLALCVAAGLGFDDIRRRAPSALAWFVVGILALLSVAAGGRANLEFSVLAWALVGAILLYGDRRGYGVLLPLLLILATQLPWAWRMLPKADPENFFPPSAVFDAMAAATDRNSVVEPRSLGLDYHSYPSLPTVYGLHQVRSHNPMAPAAWLRVNRAAFGFSPDAENYFAPVTKLHPPWLDALNIGVVLSAPNLEPGGSAEIAAEGAVTIDIGAVDDLEIVMESPSHRIYRNNDPQERWFVATSWEQVGDQDIERRLGELPHASHAFVTGPLPSAPPERILTAKKMPLLLPTMATPGNVALAVNWPQEDGSDFESGFLLATSLQGPSGWTVVGESADGDQTEVLPTQIHGAFLGAWVGPNVARLRLSYVPPLLKPALAATGFGLLWVGLLLSRGRR